MLNVRSLLGIIVGGITDIVATNVLALPGLIYVVIVTPDLMRMPQTEMQTTMATVMYAHPLLSAMQVVLGILCSVLGGFVAAVIARRGELVVGALSSWLCVGLGLYAWTSGPSGSAPWRIFAAQMENGALGSRVIVTALRLKETRGREAKFKPLDGSVAQW